MQAQQTVEIGYSLHLNLGLSSLFERRKKNQMMLKIIVSHLLHSQSGNIYNKTKAPAQF